jgi:DNA-binding transcriptional MocR family regulator
VRQPSERDLCVDLGTSHVSLHEILIRLEAEGLIYREERRGWYISPQRVRNGSSRMPSIAPALATEMRGRSTLRERKANIRPRFCTVFVEARCGRAGSDSTRKAAGFRTSSATPKPAQNMPIFIPLGLSL